jgi:hypothetical protein
VVQINTGTGCHIEADMVARGMMELKPHAGAVVLIGCASTQDCHAPRKRGIQQPPRKPNNPAVPQTNGGGYWIARLRGR